MDESGRLIRPGEGRGHRAESQVRPRLLLAGRVRPDRHQRWASLPLLACPAPCRCSLWRTSADGTRKIPATGLARVTDQICQRDLAIGDVVIDVLGQEILTRLKQFHGLDCPIFRQLGDDMVALGISVGIGGVGNLKRETSEGQAGISRASSNPKSALIVRWPVGVLPKARVTPG